MNNQLINLLNLKSYSSKYEDFLFRILLYQYLSENKSEFYSISDGMYLKDIIISANDKNIVELLSDAFENVELSTMGGDAEKLFEGLFDTNILKNIEQKTIIETLEVVVDIKIDSGLISEIIQHISRFSYGNRVCSITPSSVVELVSQLVIMSKIGGSIADMTCGTAGLLSNAGLIAKSESYSMSDISEEMMVKAKIMIITSGVPCNKINAKTVDSIEYSFEEKFDIQVSNPPCNYRWSGNQMLLEDPRYTKYEYLPPKSSADMLFIENIIEHMKEDGRAGIICSANPLRNDGSVAEIRDKILDQKNLDAVIKLPGKCMYGTSIPFYILLFDNNKKTQDVFFMDSTSFFVVDSKQAIIKKEHISQIVELYSKRQERKEICYRVSFKDIKKKGNILTTENYIDIKKIERLLKKEKLVSFSSVADIIRPKKKDETGAILTSKSAKYPIDYTNVQRDKISDTKLQKGDIIFRNCLFNTMYLIEDIPQIELYASSKDLVIRTKEVTSEYLFCFFKSNLGKQVINFLCPSFVGLPKVSVSIFEKLKVPMPKEDEREYEKIFEIENHLNISISSYNELILNREKYFDSDSIENILKYELLENVKSYKGETLKLFLSNDVDELNKCFNAKAYKATLILAGSILEAILIDWLSELNGKNYFEEDYYITDKYGKTKRADLIDYINDIKYIEKPNWIDEADKAHKIRKKRNLVHAKLGINSNDINEHTCRNVINYLKDVIKSRGIKI